MSQRFRRNLALVVAVFVSVFGGMSVARAEPPANPSFTETWQRTDLPIAEGQAVRTWMWGPEAFTGALTEDYLESPDGERVVQYFDKSRMEITDPSLDVDSIWFVTNGLLVVELMTGRIQTGDNSFVNPDGSTGAALVNVAGDDNVMTGPTYASFGRVMDQGPHAVGETIAQRIGRNGSLSYDLALADQGVTIAIVDDVTNHGIASPFWNFMNGSGMVYQDGGFGSAPIFEHPYFATGRPITEPAWSYVQLAGERTLVLIQCFERRCLTYTPGNAPEWQVEAGNVGRHYYAWRYGEAS